MTTHQVEHAELGAVRIAANEVAEMDGPRSLVRVKREEVVGLELAEAVGAERPAVTLVLGIALVALGLFPFVFLFLVFTRGGHMDIRLFWITAFGLLGAWLIRLASKKRLVLLVRTERDCRKLVFAAPTSRDAAEKFAADAAWRFGYPFKSSAQGR
jgi:hypothetical protein